MQCNSFKYMQVLSWRFCSHVICVYSFVLYDAHNSVFKTFPLPCIQWNRFHEVKSVSNSARWKCLVVLYDITSDICVHGTANQALGAVLSNRFAVLHMYQAISITRLPMFRVCIRQPYIPKLFVPFKSAGSKNSRWRGHCNPPLFLVRLVTLTTRCPKGQHAVINSNVYTCFIIPQSS